MGVSALVLTVLLYFVQSSQTCFLKPQVAEGPSPTPKQVLSGQIILPDYNFTCSGVISSWEARTTGRILSSIRFQVWRLVPGGNTYHLVGENVIGSPQDVDNDHEGLQLSVANPSKQIHVSPGDFIGIFVGGDVKIQYKDSQETLAYVVDVKVPLISFTKPMLVGPAFRSVMAAPEISVNVEGTKPTVPEDSMTTTPSSQTTITPAQIPITGGNRPEQDPLPYTLIIGVTISGAVLVGVCLGIMIVAVCFVKLRNNQGADQNPSDASERQQKIVHSLNSPRRNLFSVFKRQRNVRDTIREEATTTRQVIEVDLRGRNPIHSQSTLEISYAYPMAESSLIARSNSSTMPTKFGSHTNLPLPEIPKPIELSKNPSYSTLDQLDGGEADTDDNLYDVPVFRPQTLSVPVEYEIPVSSLNSSGGLTLECSHVYESTDGMYSEIFA